MRAFHGLSLVSGDQGLTRNAPFVILIAGGES
jgi:hypothetical protein